MTRETCVVAGYLQAGGASSRFGSDKALARFGGQTLLLRMCDLVRAAAGNTSIVAPADRYSNLPALLVEDRWPGEGPLGGIVSAMQATAENLPACNWNLILSCDMPFMTGEWLRYMIARTTASDAGVVVPRSEYGLEPLCACWRTSALEAIQSAFERGTRKVTDAMKLLPLEVLDETHWKRFDSDGRLFWNMNTPEDYEEARRIFEQRAENVGNC